MRSCRCRADRHSSRPSSTRGPGGSCRTRNLPQRSPGRRTDQRRRPPGGGGGGVRRGRRTRRTPTTHTAAAATRRSLGTGERVADGDTSEADPAEYRLRIVIRALGAVPHLAIKSMSPAVRPVSERHGAGMDPSRAPLPVLLVARDLDRRELQPAAGVAHVFKVDTAPTENAVVGGYPTAVFLADRDMAVRQPT